MEGRRSAQDGGAHLEPVADAVEAVAAREQLFERTQPPVREEGRDASSQYGRRDETRPVSTGGRGGRGGAPEASEVGEEVVAHVEDLQASCASVLSFVRVGFGLRAPTPTQGRGARGAGTLRVAGSAPAWISAIEFCGICARRRPRASDSCAGRACALLICAARGLLRVRSLHESPFRASAPRQGRSQACVAACVVARQNKTGRTLRLARLANGAIGGSAPSSRPERSTCGPRGAGAQRQSNDFERF